MFVSFTKVKLNTQVFGQEGVATKVFFMSLCVAKCEKLSFLFGPLWQTLVAVQKTQ